MAFNIGDMKSNLRYGGARPTLFEVKISNPIDALADLKVPFMVQAASIPAWNVGTIQVPYFGRMLPFPGDRSFEPWSVDVINDEDFLVRNAFEAWNNAMNTLEGNIRDTPTSESSHYQSTAIVTQKSKTGQNLRTYEFLNVWPVSIGQIQLNWSSQDQIETFPVTFQYDSFRVLGATGDAGGV